MNGNKNLINLFRSATYRKKHKKNDFPIYGLELVLGRFGSGKTITLVDRVYDYMEMYPNCRLITNVQFLEFDATFYKRYFYVSCEDDLLSTMIDVLSEDVDDGCLLLIDEVKIFLAKTLRVADSLECNAFLTILGQCRKLHCLFMLSSQLYSKVQKTLRDFIIQNGDICLCKKLFPGFTYYMYYDMASLEETSTIKLKGRFKSFNFLIHSPELYEAYDSHAVVSSIKGLLK